MKPTVQFSPRTLLALVVALAPQACFNDPEGSADVKVAHGTVAENAFPGTVYVRATATTFADGAGKATSLELANVGTVVEHRGRPVLILPLANAFQAGGPGEDYLPLIQKISLKLYPGDHAAAPVEFADITVEQQGKSVAIAPSGVSLRFVGVSLRKQPESPAFDNSMFRMISSNVSQELTDRFFSPAPIAGGNGEDLRSSDTSYILIGLPAGSLQGRIVPANMITAESRDDDTKLAEDGDLVLVGFGETGGPDATTKKNVAAVRLFGNKRPTPLRTAHGAIKDFIEVYGSGLCGSDDGENYDTGAALYLRANGTNFFLGFGVRSASIASEFKKPINCARTDREDMATLVVAPDGEELDKLAP